MARHTTAISDAEVLKYFKEQIVPFTVANQVCHKEDATPETRTFTSAIDRVVPADDVRKTLLEAIDFISEMEGPNVSGICKSTQ